MRVLVDEEAKKVNLMASFWAGTLLTTFTSQASTFVDAALSDLNARSPSHPSQPPDSTASDDVHKVTNWLGCSDPSRSDCTLHRPSVLSTAHFMS